MTDTPRQTIIAILGRINPDFPADRADSVHVGDFIDSLSILVLVSELEGAFSVEFDDEDLVMDNFETLESIEALVRERAEG